MKAPSFWYRKKGLLSLLLSPLGQLYRTGSMIRRATAKPYQSIAPIICVGNIVAGGAGKTPTCLALRKLLFKRNPSMKLVFVTRGYGGTEKGPLRVDPAKHTAKEVGDEALLLSRTAPCWIGQDRAATIKQAEKEAGLIVMDDGMQNPNVIPDINLLVVDGAVGFGNQQLIPAGPLRETLNDAFSRINAIIMIGEDATQAAAYLGKPVIKATTRPGLSASFMNKPKVFAFAGIGRPQKFFDSCREAGLNLMQTRSFPDHHPYSEDEVQEMIELAVKENLTLITTTKDHVRIPELYRTQVNVLEIEMVFEDEAGLVNLVSQAIAKLASIH